MSKNPKNREKLMKIANIDKKILHIFWTTLRNSMKFSGRMCFKIILKVPKKQGVHPLFRKYNFRKTTGASNWAPPPPSCFRVNTLLRIWFTLVMHFGHTLKIHIVDLLQLVYAEIGQMLKVWFENTQLIFG